MTSETSTQTDDELMARAVATANDRCSLAWHEGDHGHRAIRISGCFPESAREIGMEIQAALFGPADRETGLLPLRFKGCGYASQAGWAAVWIR